MSRYITTPIYYVNDKPHLGHLYTTLAADILSRFFRFCGEPVKMATGTDEHGAKVEQAALRNGITPQQHTDIMSVHFKKLVEKCNIQNTDFIRTTEDRHKKAVHALWQRLIANDQIYQDHYAGWYSVRDESFYDEKEITQTPNGPIAPTGAPVEWIQEPCYFFRLSQWQEPLIEHYTKHPDAIAPSSRYNEVISFLKSGLKDLSISRSKLKWGVLIPDSDHVFYVWIDALTNYLTVLGYPNDMKTVHQFWPHSLHLVGKDILRFHAVYWPALLMAAQLPPPSRIFAHGWWMHDGQKMSKSLGNVIDPINMIDDYGIDRVRYFLFRHVRFGQDGDFSTNLFVQKCNQELADGLGNLAHRTLTFIHNRMGGMVPRIEKTTLDDQGQDLITWGQNHYQYWVQMMNEQDLFSYLESIYAGIQKGNQYIDHRAPWTLMKKANQGCAHSQNQVNNIMYTLLSIIRDIAVALYPVIPQSSQALWTQLGYTTPLSDHNNLQGLLQKEMDPETPLPRPTPLFQKMDDAMHTS